MSVRSRLSASILLLVVASVAGGAAPGAPVTSPAALTFDDKGALVGEQLPDLALRTIDNEPVDLSREVYMPTLIVTSSFTCPKSRTHYPELADLAAKYKDKLHVVILYVIEAHPSGDPSPYRNGKEDVTPENERDGILRRQPTTFDKRAALAEAFKDRFAIKMPILVDGMENWGWKSVGAGPNMAILVDSSRVVRARQGWFGAASLVPEINKLVATEGNRDPTFATEADKALEDQLLKDKVIDSDIFPDNDKILDEKPPGKFAKLLKKYPGLIRFAWRYQARGDEGGETLLQGAVREKRDAAVKMLLNAGADPDRETPWRAPAVYLAAESGQDDMLKLLLTKSHNVDYRLHGGPTALQIALLNAHPTAAKLLRDAHAQENFFTYAASGNMAAMKAAMAKDEGITGRPDGNNHTPLDYAAAEGQTEVVKLLTATQAGLPRLEADDEAVINAVRHNHPETLSAILGAGGNPNGRDHGWYDSALQVAVDVRDPGLVDILLKAGATVDAENEVGETPLHNAAANGDAATMKRLIDAGADVNKKIGVHTLPCGPGPESTEETPLQFAAESGSVEAVKMLLDHHADVSPEDTSGKTALDHAKDAAIKKVLDAAGAKKGSGKPHEPTIRPEDDPLRNLLHPAPKND